MYIVTTEKMEGQQSGGVEYGGEKLGRLRRREANRKAGSPITAFVGYMAGGGVDGWLLTCLA
jgi:hypothetical protein